MTIPWPTYYTHFPPKLSRLSAIPAETLTTESVYRRLQDDGWLLKTLLIRVRIFDVCQEHLQGRSYRPIIGSGGGGGGVYSYIRALPDGFILKSIVLRYVNMNMWI